jgi:transcriptional regulator with XRE-family HTH domain
MNERLDLHIGKRLRARRRLLGLTQGDLGRRIGVRFQQIQKYECAANRTSASTLWRLAIALGVTVHYFYEGWSEDRRDPNQDGGVQRSPVSHDL